MFRDPIMTCTPSTTNIQIDLAMIALAGFVLFARFLHWIHSSFHRRAWNIMVLTKTLTWTFG